MKIRNCILVLLPTILFTQSQSSLAYSDHGFYAGLEVGAASQTFQYENSYNLQGTRDSTSLNFTTPFNTSDNGLVFNGGGMLGYSKPINHRFGLDFEFAATGNAGSSSMTDQMLSPFTYTSNALQEYTAKTTAQILYGFDFAIKPTMQLTKELNAYLKAGVSNAELETTLNMTHNNALTNEVYSISGDGTEQNNMWGYVFGTGLTLALSKHYSIFGEYNLHQYQSTSLKKVTVIDNGDAISPGSTVTNTITYYRKILPFTNTFNIGLVYYFK